MKFLRNCPLYNAFTNCPTVVYQNFLGEFWSTAVAFDPFPSTDEPEKHPLKEFLIKFSVLNGHRPLTLDFHTFCSSTGLNYNNGKYVDHPTPEVVKKELGNIAINPSYLDKTPVLKNSFPAACRILFTFVIQDPSKVTDIELTTHIIAVNNQMDSVSPPPLVAKPKKGKSQTVASTLPKSHGPEASGALSKKSKKPKSKKPPIETKVTPPKPTEGSEQSHSVSSNTVPDPQDLERDIQLASTGLPSTLDEGTRQSKPLPEGTATHPKDSGGNKQPHDRDITSTTSNEGTAKTAPRTEGLLGDKDSEGNIPPADMEPIQTLVANPLGTGAKYQVDETQSTRLRYRSLTKNEDKTSSELESDIEPLQLQTYANIQAFLLFDDEFDKESDEEEVLAAGDDMDEDVQADEEVRTPSPKQDRPEPSHVQESASDSSSPDLKNFDNTLPLTERQLIKYLRKVSRVLFNRITEKQWEQHEEATVSYANLKASIDQYYDENIAHRDQTDKLMEASMSSLDRSSTTINDLYKVLNVITQLLKDINNVVKDDPAANQKIIEATKTFARISSNITKAHALKQEEASAAWTKSSTNMAWNLGSRMTAIEISQTALKSEVSYLRQDTSEIKSIMAEIYQAFKGQPSSAPSGSVTPTLALTHIPANKADEEAKLLAMSRPEVIKVVQKEAENIGLDPRKIASAKAELNRRRAKEYMWTMTNRIKSELVTDIKIHPNTKPIVASVFRNNDKRNFEVYQPFKFSNFGITELDELGPIIQKKKNFVVKDLMTSLRKRYERLKKIPKELGIWDDIHKVRMDPLVSYLVMASMVKTKENARLSLKLRKLIANHPDQDKLKSKKVKLEALGYHVE
ncbi:hypothetical protein Tco_1150467 [Tanacetum coccineum]